MLEAARPGKAKSRRLKEETVANPIPVGSGVSSGTYERANCGYQLQVQSVQSMPPCPNCEGPYAWNPRSGGDSSDDPYPDE